MVSFTDFIYSQTHIHFIGIAGTAMGSAAVALKRQGYKVTGSDVQIYPPMSDVLRDAGIKVYNEYNASHLNPLPDVTVVGNVISRGNPEAEEVLADSIPYISLPQLIADYFIKDKKSYVVTGTHGKSTTTALLAWIFSYTGINPGYLIGGVPADLPSSCEVGSGDVFTIEGDEYDTAFFDKRSKFVHYFPFCLIINNIELDHVDIFRDIDVVRRAFYDVMTIVNPRGVIIANYDNEEVRNLVLRHPVVMKKLVPVFLYGMSESVEYRITDINHNNGNLFFKLTDSFAEVIPISTRLCGDFQAYNVTAAVIAAQKYGIPVQKICEAVELFNGLKRRMEVKGTVREITVIDDFAHHPTAIAETLNGVRKRYEGRRIWAVVEPRSNSMRRSVFQERLTKAFPAADSIVFAGVDNPGKVAENERLHPELVVEALKAQGKNALYIPEIDDIVKYLALNMVSGDVVIGMSNGGFGNFHQKLLDALSSSIV